MDFTIDGSETSWLVYADWLEDHDLNAAHIREPLFVNDFCYEFKAHNNEVGSNVDGHVGPRLNGTVGTEAANCRHCYVGANNEGYFGVGVGFYPIEFTEGFR
jgi:hypothetical protein